MTFRPWLFMLFLIGGLLIPAPALRAQEATELVEATDPVMALSPATETPQPDLIESATPSAEATAEVTPTVMPTATVGGVPLRYISGQATYQNREPDNSQIQIRILDEPLNLLSVTTTDANGTYAVAVPAEAFYWLVADAPLHRRVLLAMQPGDPVPPIIMAGGDFNQDGCIGPSDLIVLLQALDTPASPTADVTGDGVTDVADLAIVTGNFQPDCEPEAAAPEATEEATPELTPEVESTAEVTPEVETTEEATPVVELTEEITPEVTPEIEATDEATAEVTPAIEATPDVTVEPEATEEITPEVEATVEITPEAEDTQEVTPAVTVETTAETRPTEVTPEATLEVTAEGTAELTAPPVPTSTDLPLVEVTEEPQPTATDTATPTATATHTLTPTHTPTLTMTPSAAWTLTPTLTATPTASPIGS